MRVQVAIAMPHYCQTEKLAATIRSLDEEYGASRPPVFVCDDGSPSFQVAGGLTSVLGLPRKDHALNPCLPMNQAIEAAFAWNRAEYGHQGVVALTNPGTVFRKGMLERMASLIALDGPRTYVWAECVEAGSGRRLAYAGMEALGGVRIPEGSGPHFLAMFTAELWQRCMGFDERYRDGQGYEDTDFLWRLSAAGMRFRVADGVVVENERSRTVWPAGGLERNRQRFREKWPGVGVVS